MNKILTLFALFLFSGCGASLQQIKDESLKASRCLINCAIKCSAESAVELNQCQVDSEQIKNEAIKAAKCMAKCAIDCGMKSIESNINDE